MISKNGAASMTRFQARTRHYSTRTI